MPAKLSPFGLAVAFAALAAGSGVVAGAAPAFAQSAPAAADAQRSGAALAGDVSAGAPKASANASATIDMRPQRDVDESALRFYAAQKDHGRVEAETRRLKTLYPDWSPPEDLWTLNEQTLPDEGPLWELFSADRMDELVALIDQRKQAEPGWAPSHDLEQKIHRKQARRIVVALWNEKKWKELVSYAQSDPLVAEIGDVDILWSLAEGFANAKQKTGALAIYTSILNGSTDPAERIGTLHKAIANLQMTDVEKLVALGKKGADGKNEFDVVLVDIARARISAYLHDERKEEVAEGDLKAFEDYARAAADPNQPGLVAWYRYKRGQFKEGLDWFKLALQKGGDSMIAHGLAHSLRELGYFRETEEVAFAWREQLINNRILYVDILERDLTREIPPYVETERLARYGRLAVQDASGEAAQALAWYAYNSCQFEAALEWFERAMAWLPKQETNYGYALTLRRLKRDPKFLEVVNRADGLHPKVVELLFPEERYRPPTPCETASWEQARWWEAFVAQNPWTQQQKNDAVRENSRPLPGRQGVAPTVRHGDGPYSAGYDGFVQNALHDPLNRYSWGVVTGPTGRVYPQWRPETATFYPPTFNQIELPTPDKFPLAVLPENPLRFAALAGAPDAVDKTGRVAPASQPPAAGAGVYGRDPYQGPFPIIARRVADVGAMPYEKFGGVVLPNPEPGKPLGAAPAPAPATSSSSAASRDATGSIVKVAAPAQPPAPPVIPPPPSAMASGPLPLSPPPGATWATPPELQQGGMGGGMAGMAGAFARPAAYAPLPQGSIYAQPAPQIYAPQTLAPPPAPAKKRAAARAAPQPQPALAPAPGMVGMAGYYGAPQTGGMIYAPAPSATMQPSPYAAPAYVAYPQAQPVVVPQPQAAAPAPVAAEPRRVAPAPRHRRSESVARPVEARPVEPRAARVASGGGGACSLGASGTAAELSPQRAVAAGWCLVNAKRPAEAAIAFDRAASAGGKVGEEAAYGKSLAMIQSNDPKAAATAAAEGGVRGSRRESIGQMALEQRIFQAYDSGDYSGTLRLLRQRSAHAPETRDLTLMRGWANYQLGDLDEAGRIFQMLDDQLSTKQSRSGVAAIYNKRTRSAY